MQKVKWASLMKEITELVLETPNNDEERRGKECFSTTVEILNIILEYAEYAEETNDGGRND